MLPTAAMRNPADPVAVDVPTAVFIDTPSYSSNHA